jgi:hypothetical protein
MTGQIIHQKQLGETNRTYLFPTKERQKQIPCHQHEISCALYDKVFISRWSSVHVFYLTILMEKTKELFHFHLHRSKNVPSVQETAYCLFYTVSRKESG